jgi:hypothetical protein
MMTDAILGVFAAASLAASIAALAMAGAALTA